MWVKTMADEVVQYPSYSQKAAYPVAHKPADVPVTPAAAVAIEAPEIVEDPEVLEVPEILEIEQPEAAVSEVAEANPSVSAAPAPKFFPLVPVASPPVIDADASPEDHTQAEPEQLAEELPEAVVELEVEVEQATEPEPVPVAELSPFQISGSLVLEPQTNSIVITQVPDALLAGSIVTETGEILTTGAIDIITPPATGEIEIIPDSPDADSADAIDSATEYVSSVAPIRSSGVMNSKAKIGVLPGKLRKSMEHVVLATTLAVSIITISSLLALAYMFGILR
jgi:hypothetical protein